MFLLDINGLFFCSLGDSCIDIICCLDVELFFIYLIFRVNLDFC